MKNLESGFLLCNRQLLGVHPPPNPKLMVFWDFESCAFACWWWRWLIESSNCAKKKGIHDQGSMMIWRFKFFVFWFGILRFWLVIQIDFVVFSRFVGTKRMKRKVQWLTRVMLRSSEEEEHGWCARKHKGVCDLGFFCGSAICWFTVNLSSI